MAILMGVAVSRCIRPHQLTRSIICSAFTVPQEVAEPDRPTALSHLVPSAHRQKVVRLDLVGHLNLVRRQARWGLAAICRSGFASSIPDRRVPARRSCRQDCKEWSGRCAEPDRTGASRRVAESLSWDTSNRRSGHPRSPAWQRCSGLKPVQHLHNVPGLRLRVIFLLRQ